MGPPGNSTAECPKTLAEVLNSQVHLANVNVPDGLAARRTSVAHTSFNLGATQADALLLQLITQHAEPVIRGIIGYKLHLSHHRADQRAEADDIYQEVLVQLLQELHQLRKDPGDHPISDVRAMAAVIAH